MRGEGRCRQVKGNKRYKLPEKKIMANFIEYVLGPCIIHASLTCVVFTKILRWVLNSHSPDFADAELG